MKLHAMPSIHTMVRVRCYFARLSESAQVIGFFTTLYVEGNDVSDVARRARDTLVEKMDRHGIARIDDGIFRTFCVMDSATWYEFDAGTSPPPTDGFSMFRMHPRSLPDAARAAWMRWRHPQRVLDVRKKEGPHCREGLC